MGGFWKAPRALVQLLAERRLTPTAYALLNVVAQAGADRPDGLVTTNGLLASLLDVSDSTIRRALRALREADLIAYEKHERRAAFTIRTTAHLRSLEGSQ